LGENIGEGTMNDSPIVGVLAGTTVDHLLVDVTFYELHETLCGHDIRGRIIYEIDNPQTLSSIDKAVKVWEQSTRQCKRCAKIWENREEKP